MLFDNHLHTAFSFDSRMDIKEALKQAKQEGIGLAVTDHLDLNLDYRSFDPNEYRTFYEKYRKMGIMLGTEAGMDPRYAEKTEEFVEVSAPDFILGSIHCIYDDNIYAKGTFHKYEREEFWQLYFSYVLECLNTHPFIDSLAHLDYPARLTPYGVPGFSFKEHEKHIVPIYEHLIKEGIALELNLKRFLDHKNHAEFKEHFSVYRELGGRLVTLGSDAHQREAVGKKIREAYRLVSSLDLKAVHFHQHDPMVDQID